MFKSVILTRNEIFQQFNIVSEMFAIYFVSILNDREVIITHFGNELSYSCDKAFKSNNIPEKNIFNLLSLCYPYIKEGVDNITLGKINNKLKYTKNFHLKMNSKNFCKEYTDFLIKNSKDKSITDLSYLQDLETDKILYECESIGNGFNSKGLTNAFEIIVQVLSNQYKDFISDSNRTEKSNLERINNIYMQNTQVEIERVLRKVIICYYIVFNWDFNNIQTNVIRNKTLIYIAMFIIIITSVVIYTYNVDIFTKKLKQIQFFNECLWNTILFS